MAVKNSYSEELLILTKTYPSPSAKHRETTCVAAISRTGLMRRLFPVPFRFLDGSQQFPKWEWIRADLIRPSEDHRPESRKIVLESIVMMGEHVSTEHEWRARRRWIEPHIVDGFATLEARRQVSGETLGFIRPTRLLGLDVVAVKDPDWTEEDKAKLLQDGLFDSDAVRSRPPLRKLPHDFYYNYECDSASGLETLRHKITDWEAGALYWRCQREYSNMWEDAFRQKLEVEFAQKDLLFLMGTIHRFPDKWLIVGLVYPPKSQAEKPEQLTLGL
jgi:hypothetical protein